MPWFYYFARPLLRVTLLLLARWQVRGRENIPRRGPLLVVSNHLHIVDPPLVAYSLGRGVTFMAKMELFRSRFTGYFISRLGAFPVHRGRVDREALRQAQRVLADGKALVMFPEASRSKNAQLQPAFPGSVLVAVRSGVPILPVGITGTEKIKGAGWWRRRLAITVNIGQPFQLPSVNGKVSREELARLTDFMMLRIAELLPVEYRGNYAGRGN